ncbi:MAG TPA: ABC transporter substrate-binding protein [Candidatus Dormibacteraeota bacterium]
MLTGAACSKAEQGASAPQQILRFPVFQDPKSWDPAEASSEAETELSQNVFDNLWRFDDSLKVVPDIATTVPTASNGGVSADGLTYTVHLRHDVVFDNGDRVTSTDVLYSWNRAAALRGAYSSNFAAIAGFSDVQHAAASLCAAGSDPLACHSGVEQRLAAHDSQFQMSGLSAPDAFTVQIHLGRACGWCLAAWTLQGTTGAIVDERVIRNDPLNWWSKPGGPGVTDGLVGTGAFYLNAYVPKQSITWKAVSHWWGTPVPRLREVINDIKDPSAMSTAVGAWEQGSYDIVGYGGHSSLSVADILRIKNSSGEAGELRLIPKGRTTWVSPNIGNPATGGPFLGESEAAVGLRRAFAESIDLTGLASTVCKNLLCIPATGGLITKGLLGNLGDNRDPLSKFNPTEARKLLGIYDPERKLTANLKYSYDAGGLNDPVASYLQGQWQRNLGVTVELDPHPDVSGYVSDRIAGKFVLSRDGWGFDYNHPQDWFDNLWGAPAEGANTSGFADPVGDPGPTTDQYNSILPKADALPITEAVRLYAQLSKLLSDQAAYFPLYYSVGQFLIHTYVAGAGSTTQSDYYWDRIHITRT